MRAQSKTQVPRWFPARAPHWVPRWLGCTGCVRLGLSFLIKAQDSLRGNEKRTRRAKCPPWHVWAPNTSATLRAAPPACSHSCWFQSSQAVFLGGVCKQKRCELGCELEEQKPMSTLTASQGEEMQSLIYQAHSCLSLP